MNLEETMPLVFERSIPGRIGFSLPESDVPETKASDYFEQAYIRSVPADLPELSELEIMRHYTNLSNHNFGVDSGFYPLGSCTMKYNPKINEKVARFPGFANIHPNQPESSVQGALELLYDLQTSLVEITGMDEVTLQPAAGAHGEWTGLMLIRAFHEKNGDTKRTKVIIPDSAHGTNPASAAVAGFDVVTVKSNEKGLVDVADLKKVVGEDTAALMLTNPNTL
ncbi:aminomethyl-transferring glycine dehydrogenase subunit GcvPB, partial [Listeria monocytogenes]|nr:aminomethyl-transferring glycine dehydrogenase subunit GcvPB [Listeria monocytogenes]